MLSKKFDSTDEQETLGSQGAASLRHLAITVHLCCKRVCCASWGRCILLLLLLSGCGVALLVLVGRQPAVPESIGTNGSPSTTMARQALSENARHLMSALRGRSQARDPTTLPLTPGGKVPPIWKPHAATPIYLSFSAFRDGARCARTLGFALEKAKHPERLHFRVMQAMDEARDVSCADRFAKEGLPKFCSERSDALACQRDVLNRTKIWTIPLEEGMGPAHQRGLLNELLDSDAPDAFCVTTDSHMDFHHQWDELTVADWWSAQNEFAVLTAYPMAMVENQEKLYARCHVDLCGYFLEAGIPRGKTGGNLPTNPGDKPYFTMNWAAGLSFHRCHADRNVPVDKYLRYIFTGEEVDRAVRLWTHGYDLYLPSTTTIYHDYQSAKQDFWNYNVRAQSAGRRMSRRRLATLLELDESVAQRLSVEELEPFGLGQQRTLEQWVEWSRVDLGAPRWKEFLERMGKPPVEAQSAEGRHDFCQTLKRVPVRDVHSLSDSAKSRGLPPGSDPAASPAKRVGLQLIGES
mmetsp:Transcript_64189/g.187816  ORF Transcript_64189/g.187816 Transcript_64189/m.187816 type:complete len:522 (+) Transcript_64189:62-1627(+)